MLKTRFNRFAQVIEALFSAGVWSNSSGDWAFLHLPRLAGVTRARYLLLATPACSENPAASPTELENGLSDSRLGRVCRVNTLRPCRDGGVCKLLRSLALPGEHCLELEYGSLPISEFYANCAKEGRPINYGASVAWGAARIAVFNPEGLVDGKPVPDIEWWAGSFK